MSENDQKKDFEADKLLQSHDTTITSLVDRVCVIEQKLSNPEQLAQTLEAATADSKKLDKLFSSLFCNMMKNDESVKAAIVEKMASVDRDAVNSFIKKFGGKLGIGVWTLFVAGITAWVTAWAEHHFK